jgi:hypothetical protein
MKRFIQRFSDKIIGVLSGFDRLVFRGNLRRVAFPEGLMSLLWHRRVLLKDYSAYVTDVTEQLKEASYEAARKQNRPIVYLEYSKTDKDKVAREIAKKDHITEGLVAVLKSVELCRSFELHRNSETKKLEIICKWRKGLHLYHYLIDPKFGFMNARIQTWIPFYIQICLNGREWLARQMDRNSMRYTQLDNCFAWIEDFEKAQRLMDQQLKTNWPRMLDRIARMLNPAHGKIFRGFPARYYWSAYQSEWATDVAFKSRAALASIYPTLTLHGITTYTSHDVLRFLGRKLTGHFGGEVVSDFKIRPEGVRIKHSVNGNSVKMYDKSGRVLRVETTIQDPHDFKVFRPKENDPRGECDWRMLRYGVADLHRRSEVCQAANERYLDAQAAVDTCIPLGDLVSSICQPTLYKGHRVRALRPWDQKDLQLFQAVTRGEFSINGFRNRDLQALLFKGPADSPQEKRRRSGQISRLLRMLRAHHLVKRVPKTYRYMLTQKGRDILTAILTTRRITLEQLNKAAA